MDVFLMHVGHMNVIDIDYTVKRRRRISEIADSLPTNASELPYFRADSELGHAFPDGLFNCWGVPTAAEPSFAKTKIGDLVLIVPHIGLHDGGVSHIGVVRAKCPVKCHAASRILWPETPDGRLFPSIFFFRTETGFRAWFDFLSDVGIKDKWQPRGWYRRIGSVRFEKWGGAAGYLTFLRSECGFGISEPAI